jgi:hypothetical protein
MMTTVATQPQPRPLDNFASYDDSVQTVDGDRDRSSLLPGTRLKFTNEATWESPEGVDFSGKHLLAVNVRRTEVKWGDGVPAEVIELGPGERYRDLDAVNETIDKSEWREGPSGQLQGPWQRQHVLELIDVKTMETLSWPTATVGGSIAIRELVEKIQRMRRFRGEHVYPLVKLDHKPMRTRYGGRERPHLEVLAWFRVGDHGVQSIDASARLALTRVATEPPLQSVQEPTLREELQDHVPY